MIGYAKLIMIASAALLVGVVVYKIYDAGGDAREAKLTAEHAEKLAEQERAARAQEILTRAELNKRSADYEAQIAALRANTTPVPVIRVRKCPVNSVPSAAAIASEPIKASGDGLDREDGQPSPEVQFSNGLREYAIDCKAVAIQLKSVIESWPNAEPPAVR